jgi:Mrp family chromosome partitioning ATPase
LAILHEERTRVQNELDADRTEQDALNKQLGMAAVGITAPDLIDDDIGKTREELIKARTDHDVAAARFTAMDAGQESSAAIEAAADELIASDPGLTSMKTSLNQRRAILITQMANLTPSNPEYRQDAEELIRINSTLDSMMNDLRAKAASRIQQGLRTDLARTAGVEAQLNGQLRQLAGTAASATPKLQRAGDLANDILRLRTRYTSVDEQLHNLMLQDSVPGAVHLSVAAVAPLHPTISGILRKTLPLALGGLLLGLLAALIANNLDPRVYIASDIEQVLGFAPMAVLPDFTEVSDEVAAEHLLRISAAIEHACKQGNLKSGIFTGTESGTGVTTVATKVREMLEAMGRATVLVDASGTPPTAPRVSAAGNGHSGTQSLVTTQRGSRSTALLQQVAEETETQAGSLVLTDTAPLVISAETAYLARFVDCVIVVIESGVTTRAQLREVATTLQRLNVAAVGFVLNRVGLAKADPGFRQSVYAVERHLRSQSRSTAKRTVKSSPSDGVASPEGSNYSQEAAARAQSQPVPEPASAVAFSRSSPALARWSSDMAEPQPILQRFNSLAQAQESNQPKQKQDSEMPWWLADIDSSANVPVSAAIPQQARVREPETASAFYPVPPPPRPQPEMPPAQSWERVSNIRNNLIPAAPAEEVQRAEEEDNPNDAASRLSGLRNLLFSLGLKNLNNAQGSSSQGDESLPQSEAGSEYEGYTRIYTAPLEPAPVPVASAKSNIADTSARLVTAQPEFLPPKSVVVTIDKEQAQQTGATNRRDRRDAFDEVEILPSWRGQYRKKD